MLNASILLAQTSPELTLQSWQLSFRGLLPLWLAIPLFILLGLVLVGTYLAERGKFHWGGRLALSMVRLCLLALVIFLLCRPIVLVVYEGERARGVPVLVDVSESMEFADLRQSEKDKQRALFALGKIKANDPIPNAPDAYKNASRVELVQGVVEHRDFKLIDGLQTKGPVRAYLFGSHLRGAQTKDERGPAGQIDYALSQKLELVKKLKSEGKSADFVFDSTTALTDAIHEILSRKDDDLPAAIVLMTDGQDNAGKYSFSEIAARCKELGVPLHIWGVGTSEGVDLKLREVALGDTIFAEDNVQVPIRYRAQGLPAGSKLEIVVTLDGNVVKTKDVVVQAGDDLRELVEFVVPKLDKEKSEDNRKLQVTLRHKGLNLEDNLPAPLDIRIVERKIRVLYVEHAPRFEYRYLQPALLRDRRIEPTFLLVNADPMTAKSGPPFISEFPSTREKFFDSKFNVIILGDVAASYLGKDKLDWIKEFVENRGGLVLLAGRQNMPASYEGTPIAEMLPVEFVAHKAKLPTEERTQEYPPTLTEFGERMTMMALAESPEENREIWKKLPGFYWNYPVAKLKPSGVSLLSNPRAKMGEDPMTIAATHHFGKGQVLYLGTDETWRWRSVKENKYFVRFWGQIVYQLGLPSLLGETAKRAQFAIERSEAFLGQPSSIFVRLLDKEFNPRKDKEVEATLEYLDATAREDPIKIKLNAIEGREGDYRGLLTNERKGAFKLTVTNPDPYTYDFRVKVPPGHELSESAMNEAALKMLAESSGGGFYREEDLPGMAAKIVPQSATFTQRQEILLWNPLMLFVFLGLITLEWIVRKVAHLS